MLNVSAAQGRRKLLKAVPKQKCLEEPECDGKNITQVRRSERSPGKEINTP
jgi:hypothetical protein